MKRSLVFALFYLCAPVLLAARTVQKFYMIDVDTGFFAEGFGATGMIITVAFLLFAVVELVMTALSKPERVVLPDNSRSMAVGTFAAGICLMISAVGSVITGNNVAAIADFIFALCMFWRGLTLLSKVSFDGMLAMVGVVYFLVKLVLGFAGYAGEVAVADSVFDIVTMCLLVLFFTAEAKVTAGVSNKKTAVAFYGYGLSAALFCICSVFPSLINLLMGGAFEVHGSPVPDITYIGFAVYILIALNSAKEDTVAVQE